MRFVFSPPAEAAAGLLDLPWDRPLEEWADPRIVEVRQRGISRHIVRFAEEGGVVYALKEITPELARKEYQLLRRLTELQLPVVEVLGVVVDRPHDLDAVLVTKYLDYSVSYRALFSNPRGAEPVGRLLDALVELIARLHLAGFYWGDCSLSNTLFRLDAGALSAYLVDAETGELYPSLSPKQREYDVFLASTNVGGELMDLEAGGLLPEGFDVVAVSEEIPRRYASLWDELTREELLQPGEQRYRIAERLRRLNELGFDVDEVEITETPEGNRVRIKTRVAEPGHHRRLLYMRTGLDAEEGQARRLLNDIASFRGYLEQKEKRPLPEAVVANRWLAEVYDPVVAAIPGELRERLQPAEVFHEILEHRWYLSEGAGRDVGTTAAARSYFANVLPAVPEQLTAGSAPTAGRSPK
ncbi:MAG TPA: DUF4032 domain-containing protein [Mycobacteriales bacterium]|jgi:tRNA A-37 threonylcarbamoyl transferase component Bud32|nr:DUF4032 domain-containing protein [Mycobacteriales bacterium]